MPFEKLLNNIVIIKMIFLHWLHIQWHKLVIQIIDVYSCLQYQHFSEKNQNHIFASEISLSHLSLSFLVFLISQKSSNPITTWLERFFKPHVKISVVAKDRELPPSPWISTLKSSICHTAQPLGRSAGESIARACKDVRSAKKYVSGRGKGKEGDGFIYYRRSVIWIFTIAAAEPGRDSFPWWRHRIGLTRSVAHGHPHLLQIADTPDKCETQISSGTRSPLRLLFHKYSGKSRQFFSGNLHVTVAFHRSTAKSNVRLNLPAVN